jgi:hypothetical protein
MKSSASDTEKISEKRLNELTVYDVINLEEIPVKEYLSQSENNIVFILDNKALGFDRDEIRKDITSRNYFVECKQKGFPYIDSVNKVMYIVLRGEVMIYVLATQLQKALDTKRNIFILKPSNKLEFTVHVNNIIVDQDAEGHPLNFRLQRVNFVSSDHCQDGSSKQVYDIFTADIEKIGGSNRNNRNDTITKHRKRSNRSVKRRRSLKQTSQKQNSKTRKSQTRKSQKRRSVNQRKTKTK